MSADDKFKIRTTAILSDFRRAVEQVVYSVCRTLQSSRSLLNTIGIDLKTSYQIYKLLGPIDLLSTVQYVPAAVSFKKLLTAAKKHGAPELHIQSASAVYDQLQVYVAETFGDIEAFEIAVMSYGDQSESSQVSLAHRKAAFKASVYFHGVSVDTLAMALFFHPGKEPGRFDFVSMRQMIGLRRLRAETDVVVERLRLSQQPVDRKNLGSPYFATAFDEAAATAYDAAVLPEFCTQPVLPMYTAVDSAGHMRTLLRHRDLGVGRLVDLTTGRVHRGAVVEHDPDGSPVFRGLIEIARPTRLQIIDQFIHRSTWPNLKPRSGVFANLLPRRSAETIEEDGIRLPFAESLVRIDRQTALRVPEAPRHTELLEHTCRTMGWQLDEFDAFRFRIEYPLLDSNIHCCVESIQQ